MTRAVAVTGVGLVTAAGHDVRSSWAAVQSGLPTAKPDRALGGSPVTLSCRVPAMEEPLAPGWKRLDPFARFALMAMAEAITEAGLDPARWDSRRVAVVMGSGAGGSATQDQAIQRLAEGKKVSPYFLPGYLPNMAGAEIAIRFAVTGPSLTVFTACASGATAIELARDLLLADTCDIALACGSDASVSPLMVAGFAQLGALSNRASRPFDQDRDGFVISEGAGAMVLERVEDARARGAKPLARLLGTGASTDAHHLVAPHPAGLGAQRALLAALDDAELAPGDIDHVNAHGTSTQLNDKIEAAMLRRTLPHGPSVTSTKGALGHALAAAGSIEAVITVLAVRDGVAPPTAGLTRLAPGLDLDVVTGVGRNQAIKAAISNSFGFGGHNAVLVFGK